MPAYALYDILSRIATNEMRTSHQMCKANEVNTHKTEEKIASAND